MTKEKKYFTEKELDKVLQLGMSLEEHDEDRYEERKKIKPSDEEIVDKLIELNRIYLLKDRVKKLQWFTRHKIEVFVYNGRYMMVPDGIQRKELERRLNEMNAALAIIQENIAWFKQEELIVKLQKTTIKDIGETSSYVYDGEKSSRSKKKEK